MKLAPRKIPCPICGAPTRNTKLMCLRHWLMVPKLLREKVSYEWWAVNAARKPDVRLAALRRHREAKQAAIAAVRARIPAQEAA